jgi:pyridoxal phosphate enzyme (YggS family)
MPFASRLTTVEARIALACVSKGRARTEVRLLAVSKTAPVTALREALQAGQRAFGESYLQEALPKIASLAGSGAEWHFIGPVQSNKTAAIAAHFDWVHGVDRLKIAERLSAQRPPALPPLNVCLQVNISGEPSKSGCTLAALPTLADAITRLPGIRLRGLMAIPAPVDSLCGPDPEPYRQMQQAWLSLARQHPQIDTLSMGMSDDLEIAIAHGATMVRIGTALFGMRQRVS